MRVPAVKILLVMDPGILVPPKGYGGHERLVAMFAQEYRRLDHDVHLLVTSGSLLPGCAVHGFGREGFPPKPNDARLAMLHAWKFLFRRRNDFDLIHNFGRLAYLLPILNHPVRKIMTYGREISTRNIRWITRLPSKRLIFTGCSSNLIERSLPPGQWRTVYNAIEFDRYELRKSVAPDAPLMFLGRIERVKGCHTAIQVAKETGRRLVIAGNISPLTEEQEYFKTEIEPYIDGAQIQYVGSLNDEQKNHYLGEAAALLFPIEWEEPFGMVMAEAMACGTPVVALKRGSVPEVVDDGVTGIVATTRQGLIKAVGDVASIDRTSCREHARSRFDVSVVAERYLHLFDDADAPPEPRGPIGTKPTERTAKVDARIL